VSTGTDSLQLLLCFSLLSDDSQHGVRNANYSGGEVSADTRVKVYF
jgi:hypothetical protein